MSIDNSFSGQKDARILCGYFSGGCGVAWFLSLAQTPENRQAKLKVNSHFAAEQSRIYHTTLRCMYFQVSYCIVIQSV
jgi:ferredoxin-NADP reductase